MATFVEMEVFSEDLVGKVHNLNSVDQCRWYLTNTAPAATQATRSALPTELANGNGYTTNGLAVTVSRSRSGNQTTLSTSSVVMTATGALGPFRYAILYNDAPTSPADPCIGYYDRGSSLTMAINDTYTFPTGAFLTVN